jgi:intracellular sulfur oxidation DsrE/DsrF family protein
MVAVMKKRYPFLFLLFFLTGMHNTFVQAGDEENIQSILRQSAPPEGVVFEVLADKDGLSWAIPRVKRFSDRLRQRFPGLSIAVVSHGREQFALQSIHARQYDDVHKQVQSLVADDDVKVHVCGTYAEWKGVSPEAFPEYVDVAAEGPAQIRAYQELGYIKVVLSRPE